MLKLSILQSLEQINSVETRHFSTEIVENQERETQTGNDGPQGVQVSSFKFIVPVSGL
jgi:hypothetical protein